MCFDICHDLGNLIHNVLDKNFRFINSDDGDTVGQSIHLILGDIGHFIYQKAVHFVMIEEKTACADSAHIFVNWVSHFEYPGK